MNVISLHHWIFRPILVGVLLFYFGFHIMYGDQGLIGQVIESHKQHQLQADITQVTMQRQQIEHRIALLSGHEIDEDLLDEMARRQLPIANSKELIIVD